MARDEDTLVEIGKEIKNHFGITKTKVFLVLVVFLGFFTFLGSYYTVDPTQMAGVRRFGTVVSKEPIGPGLHFKMPWIDTVDYLQVSMETYKLNDLRVYTVDNQEVVIDVGVLYRIPRESVLKLLYGVGRAGSGDVSQHLERVMADRALREFSTRNTLTISEKKGEITNAMMNSIRTSAKELYGIETVDVQLPEIRYSIAFRDSVERAAQTKSEAQSAQNVVAQREAEGRQLIAKVNAETMAQVTRAEADKKAAILKAQGEAEAKVLQGEAEAKSIVARAAAMKNADGLVELIKAERWKGDVPSTVMGNTPIPLMNVGK
jgi:regulator of protease activity HflC (stomatin/prohibitin superfamily)